MSDYVSSDANYSKLFWLFYAETVFLLDTQTFGIMSDFVSSDANSSVRLLPTRKKRRHNFPPPF
jgi:hypothetical protein